MEDKIPFCSFCGKTASQVKRLIAATKEDTFICDECVAWCSDLLEEERASELNANSSGNDIQSILDKIDMLKPAMIKSYLDQYIIGQDDAKKSIAVADYNHYKRIIIKEHDADIQ